MRTSSKYRAARLFVTAMAGVFLSSIRDMRAVAPYKSAIGTRQRPRSSAELPRDRKWSYIHRINCGRVTGFGPSDMNRSRPTFTVLMALTAIALYLCYLLVAPFLKAIIFSSILAAVFYPLHTQIRRWIRNRNAAAVVSTSVL